MDKSHCCPSIQEEARQYIAEKAGELAMIASTFKFELLKQLIDLVVYESDPRALAVEQLREVAAEMRKRYTA